MLKSNARKLNEICVSCRLLKDVIGKLLICAKLLTARVADNPLLLQVHPFNERFKQLAM